MTPKKQESWIIKNIFSLIALSITVGGFIAGYTKLNYTVEDLKAKSINTDLIRKITKEIVKQELVSTQKDINYMQKDMSRINDNISRLYKISNKLEMKGK